MKYHILLINLITFTLASTPFYYGFSFSNGYDNNVLRLSSSEVKEINSNMTFIDGVDKMDSYISKFGFKVDKTIYIQNKKEVLGKINASFSNFHQNEYKKYWSGGFDFIYKWGSYKNLKYSLRHLNNFYLRHYINRDISIRQNEPCLFTDQNQKITLTHPIKRRLWINFTTGFLQRYYNDPFQEFDLDIYYLRFKLNKKVNKIGQVAIQLESGNANPTSITNNHRPSFFDRSYDYLEWYIPLILKLKLKEIKQIGFSIRIENRMYEAEDLNDPLHSGREHHDIKYDLWALYKINPNVSIRFSTRYRERMTYSQYKWVSSLKSFNQLQTWLKLEWNLLYDKY